MLSQVDRLNSHCASVSCSPLRVSSQCPGMGTYNHFCSLCAHGTAWPSCRCTWSRHWIPWTVLLSPWVKHSNTSLNPCVLNFLLSTCRLRQQAMVGQQPKWRSTGVRNQGGGVGVYILATANRTMPTNIQFENI